MAGASARSGITSPSKIIANIFISFIGAGLLGLPYAFKESGILEGTLIMSLVGYLSVAAMLMLIDCKYAILTSGGRSGGRSITMESKVPLILPESSEEEDFGKVRGTKGNFSTSDLTYGDIGLYALGSAGKRLVDITIVISQIGFCCGYLIYLCENLKKHLNGLTQGQWLVLLLPPLYGLTLLRHLNKLAIFSLFAQVSNVLALAVVFWFDFSHSEEVPFHPKEVSLKGLPFFFAVSIYCYEGAGMILSLEESVAENKKKKFKPIFVGTMIALTLLYVAFGASGYLSFGPHTQQIITLNLPQGHTSVDFAAVVKICLGVSFFFTYPMMMFPVTHLIDKTSGFHNDRTKGNMVRLVLVLLTGIIVIAIPSFAVLASLIGATCCTMLAFIMPATFHMAIFKNRLTKRQKYFDMFLIGLGIFGTVIGLWDALHRISEPTIHVNELVHHPNSSTFGEPKIPTVRGEIAIPTTLPHDLKLVPHAAGDVANITTSSSSASSSSASASSSFGLPHLANDIVPSATLVGEPAGTTFKNQNLPSTNPPSGTTTYVPPPRQKLTKAIDETSGSGSNGVNKPSLTLPSPPHGSDNTEFNPYPRESETKKLVRTSSSTTSSVRRNERSASVAGVF